MVALCPLLGAERKTYARIELFPGFDQLGHWAAASRVDCLPFLTRRTPQSARLRTSGRLSFRGTNETARVHGRVRRRCDSVGRSPLQAQQAENPVRIGFLPIGSPSNSFDQSLVEAFRQGLRQVNLVENRNITLDVVWVGKESEFSEAVSTLVQRGAKLLVTAGSSASVAAKRHTTTIPIVFVPVGNPVGIGLVESLSHPGGNATGFSDVLADLSGKYVQFASELGAPQVPVYYLWHTDWSDGQHRLQATERQRNPSACNFDRWGFATLPERMMLCPR